MLARSLSTKLLVALSVLLIGGFSAIVFGQSAMFRGFFAEQYAASLESKTTLLTAQMAGGVKWGKAQAIEKTYAAMTDPAAESGLAGVYVANTSGEGLANWASPALENIDLTGLIGDAVSSMGEDGTVTMLFGDLVVTTAEIVDPKKGDVVGHGVIAWDISGATAQIQEVGLIAIIGAIGVALAVNLALFVLLRRIATRPIRSLSASMAAIAEGELETQIPGEARKDEIGAMAAAVGVFRDNAIRVRSLAEEKEKLDAEAKRLAEEAHEAEIAETQRRAEEDARAAEASRRAEADRIAREADEKEAARTREKEMQRKADEASAQMMRRLSDSFGQMVESARRGDFSARIDANFDDDVLNRLASGLNQMAETVEAGLARTTSVLGAVGQYDLAARVEGDFEGAFAVLQDGVNQTIDTLADIMTRLQDATGALRTESSSLEHGFSDLSNRTAQQAASIQETSAAVNLLTESVKQNAERAETAQQRSAEAKQGASKGGEVMREATDAMDRVAESSKKISEIVGLIDSIAFQTNLLSLNASVEAARAGEAGAGFAVVAQEVRKLAQSAANASGDIRDLIERSGADVRDGVELVAKASESLTSILSGVEETNGLVSEITRDAADQASRLAEVNTAIEHIDTVTQQNAALVDQSNQALSTAAGTVESIDEIASAFALDSRPSERMVA